MGNIWNILEIEKTTDKQKIKKAYHKKLRETNPEDKQDAFIRLRQAYEEALELADTQELCEQEKYGNWDNTVISTIDKSAEGYEGLDSSESDQKNSIELRWWNCIQEVYDDLDKRWDAGEWYALLYEDIPFQLTYYDRCRERLRIFLFERSREVFLPQEVWSVIDGFFSYSGTDVQRSEKGNRRLVNLNKKVKLNELFRFDKFDCKGSMKYIDYFCKRYSEFIEMLFQNPGREKIRQRAKNLHDKYRIFYLPLECMCLALQFEENSPEATEKQIEVLQEKAGDTIDIRLLKAEYYLYQKRQDEAKELLKEIMAEVDKKDFVMIYQLSECFICAGMYREAWQMLTQLIWLNPKPVMFEKREMIYKIMEGAYESNQRGFSVMDSLFVCRLYLDHKQNKRAWDILNQIKPEMSRERWEYHFTLCKYALACGDDESAVREAAFLTDDISDLSGEWRELRLWELQTRILFEEGKYREVICACNDKLEEYPFAYPVLLLREHADFCDKGKWCKRYADIRWLLEMAPKDVDARILSASIMWQIEDYDEAIAVLEPVKEFCYPQLEYLRIMKLKYSDYKEYYRRGFDLLRKATEGELPIEAKSRHNLLDLNSLFMDMSYVCYYFDSKEEKERIFAFVERLEQSKYNNPRQFVDKFKMYYEAQMYDEAIETVKKKLEGENDEDKIARYHSNIFESQCKAGHFRLALEELPYFIHKKEIAEEVYPLIGRAYEAVYRFEEAEEYFIKNIKCNCVNYSFLKLANFYTRRGQKEKAVRTMEEGIRIWGNLCKLYMSMVIICHDLDLYDKAIEYSHLMYKYSEDDDYIRRQYNFCLGKAYVSKGCYETALEYFRKADEEDCPIDSSSNKAICFYGLEKYEEARGLFKKGIDINARLILLYVIQHCSFWLNEEMDNKLTEKLQMEAERQLKPHKEKKREYLKYLGDVMAQRGDFEQAEKYYEQAEREKPCEGCYAACYELLWSRAWLYIYQRRYEDALVCLEKALEKYDSEKLMYFDYLKVRKLVEKGTT